MMSNRKVFNDSITPLPEQGGVALHGLMLNAVQPVDKTEKMNVLFSLNMPEDAQKELEDKVAAGQVVTPAELKNKYMPEPADVNSLVSWLKSQGYEVGNISPNGTGVYANASIQQIEDSLQVQMVSVIKDGLTYNATKDAPSLPADVGKSVHAIIGLQPFRQANKHRKMAIPKNGNRTSMADRPSVRIQAAPNISNAPPYLVSEILKAYHADGLSVTGKGQTIAILIDTFPADDDLTQFWSKNNVAVSLAQIQKINVKGSTLPAAEGEETLDAEWTSGVAPGANIRIYASGSLNFVDLDTALDNILTDAQNISGMRQLSISLGLGETYMGGPQGEAATQHQKYLRLAALGVNVFVSTGDAGSNPDSSGHSPSGPLQVEYSSSDPCVVAVGGTSLKLSSVGAVAGESGWSAGGGGKSIFFTRPSWQSGPGVPAGNNRLVPDVSLTADPDEGAFLILNGNVEQIGGTSWSAPVWAGFCALMNEAMANAGKPLLPFLNPVIYPLSGSSGFRDITSGSNGAYSAATAYDMVTGIGVPDVAALINLLTK